jgi:hypothetical protein
MKKIKGLTGIEQNKGESLVVHETYHEAKELEHEVDLIEDFAIFDIDSHPI